MNIQNPAAVGEVVKTNARSFRKFAQADANGENKIAFAACFASEAVRDQSDYDLVAPTRLSLANGNGGKKLLLHFRQMLQAASTDTRAVDLKAKKKPSQTLPTIEQLIEEATSEWKRRDGKVYYSFRWDPAELRRAAFMATSPADDSFSPVPRSKPTSGSRSHLSAIHANCPRTSNDLFVSLEESGVIRLALVERSLICRRGLVFISESW